MKITKLLLLAVALFAFSCSGDDEKPSLDKQALSFLEDDQVITVPPALLASDDDQAQLAASWITMANAMSSYLHYFEMPAGAQKSEAKITASNGRVKDAGDHVTYVWTDEQSGQSVAYQVSEESDRYVFEIFLKLDAAAEFLKYFHAEEKKDRSEGFMKIYDIFGISGDDTSVVWLEYDWSRAGNIFNLTMKDHTDNYRIEFAIDRNTNAGSVVFYGGGVKGYELIWDGAGNGTWAYFNDEGTVVESGAWTA